MMMEQLIELRKDLVKQIDAVNLVITLYKRKDIVRYGIKEKLKAAKIIKQVNKKKQVYKKWTPERRKKFMATVKAKQAKKAK